LNVLLEFIKAFQTGFLTMDKKFMDEFCDGIHVCNMSIMEELGVIDYILTDKTGTLTANQMIFRSCCIQDKVYSRTKLENRIEELTESSAFHNFWLSVVICHDVIMDASANRYQGSSPDEVCFVDYARTALDYEFVKRTKNHIEFKIRG
jgi:magnesium-transporting ATPase (P-type)